MPRFGSSCVAVAVVAPVFRNSQEVTVLCSKRLPQSNEDLCGFDARDRTQVMAEVHADRADRSRITQTKADGVRVVLAEIIEAETVENISAVIERHQTQSLLDRQWNAQFAGQLRSSGFKVILPQERALPMLQGFEKFSASTLFTANVRSLEEADVILANLDGADADSGTCWECGYAFKAGVPILGIRTDIRQGRRR